MKGFDLPVMDGTRKSFYGKAKVIEHDNGDICLINCSEHIADARDTWDGHDRSPGKCGSCSG